MAIRNYFPSETQFDGSSEAFHVRCFDSLIHINPIMKNVENNNVFQSILVLALVESNKRKYIEKGSINEIDNFI